MIQTISSLDPPLSYLKPHMHVKTSYATLHCRICFAVGEVLLMIGIGVESSHLRRWSRPRPNCLIVRQGLFAAAGVFGLATVILAGGLYLTALHAESLRQEEEHARREMMEVSYLYSSPVRSPIFQIRASSQGGNGTSQTCHSNSQLDKPSNSI